MIFPEGETPYPIKCSITISVPKDTNYNIPALECNVSVDTDEKGSRRCTFLILEQENSYEVASEQVILRDKISARFNSEDEIVCLIMYKSLEPEDIGEIESLFSIIKESLIAKYIKIATSYWSAIDMVATLADDIFDTPEDIDDSEET